MSYPVGTRVKKVRGEMNLGVTGVVVNPPADLDGLDRLICRMEQLDMWVKSDMPYVNGLSDVDTVVAAGTVGPTRSKEWEPILLDGLRPAEEDFTLPLPQEEHALG